MAQKGGKFDASGQPIASLRLVTDTDADTGIGSLQDPLRVDPTGTTVQPVSITGSISVTGGLTDTQLRASPVPVSAASLPLPTGAALDATLTGGTQKTKIVDSAGTNLATVSAAGAVKVDGSAVTQPVSAASLPLPTGAALDATLTGGTQKTKIVDTGGTNVASVSAAGAVKVDGSAVTQPVTASITPSSVTVANPAAGAEISITIGTTGYLQSISFRLTTSATVANRTPNIQITDTAGNRIYAVQVLFNIPASQTQDFYAANGLPHSPIANAQGQVFLPLPNLAVLSGWHIITNSSGLQAADQFSLIDYTLRV